MSWFPLVSGLLAGILTMLLFIGAYVFDIRKYLKELCKRFEVDEINKKR